MTQLWHRFLTALTPGVRVLLAVLTAFYLAALAGNLAGTVNLYQWLSVDATDCWHGQIWRIFTYALLPAGPACFLLNGLALALVGPLLERHWRRSELWLFCTVSVAGAGLTHVFLPDGQGPMVGAGAMAFAVLVAWGFIASHEVVVVPLFGQMPERQLAWLFVIASIVLCFLAAGLIATLEMLSAGVIGWLYLWLRRKWLMTRSSNTFQSERIHRLEL